MNAVATIEQHAISQMFVLGGRAIFTVANPEGVRYTFRVDKVDPVEGSRYTEPTYFVKLLTGSNNEEDYTYVGILDPATAAVRLTKKSRYTETTTAVLVIRWAVKLLWTGRAVPNGYAIYHEGRCGRCARLLTVPESIISGFGPDCIQMMGGGM